MSFASPQWLLLVPLLVAAGWQWRGLGLARPLRAACLVLVVLVLADPQVRRLGNGLDLWVLVDRSDSCRESLEPRLGEWQTILEKSRRADDRLFFIDFADEAVTRGALLRGGAAATEYAGKRSATRLAAAVHHAIAQMGQRRAARILALTDGRSTEPLAGLAETLLARGVPLDLRLSPGRDANDYALVSLALPRRVQLREGLLGEIVVRGGADAAVPLEILRDGRVIATRTADVVDGVARVRFADRVVAAGAHRYGARIAPADDAIAGNNSAEIWVEVQGGPRIVLVSGAVDPPLATVLAEQGHEVQVVSDLAAVHVGLLSGAKAVILDNVPAYRLDAGFVKGLPFFVTAQGGGLLMAGGRHAFASGGWFGSAVEPLLPVTMELKQEHRKLAVAMAIVLDRSGSMAATAPGTTRTKMALADEGAARAIELLGAGDMVVIIPVDSAAHPLSAAPLPVGPNRASLMRAARSVESTGGGIFCYTGLEAAWAMLRDVPLGQRHVILFADAADAEEPGEYQALLAEMAAGKCTVSVIGLGSDIDADAAFLADVAKRGGGRIFYSADAGELPALFEMETATIARSAFLEEPVAVKPTTGWLEIAAGPLDWPAEVDAYNLTYLRPEAAQGAVTGDDYSAPLVAFWRRAAGRTAAVTFPLGGELSERTRAWSGYGGMCQTLGRWLVGAPVPPGVGLRTGVDGSRAWVELVFDETWNERVAARPPTLVISRGADGGAVDVPWERLAPGRFMAGFDVADAEFVRGAVRIGEHALAVGPLNVTTNPEWATDAARPAELAAVAARSGGVERVDLSDVWNAPRPAATAGLRRWLLPALLVALLLEALDTQTGWLARRGRRERPRAAA